MVQIARRLLQIVHQLRGRSIDTKPESLAVILKNRRSIPSFDQFRERLSNHIIGYNRNTDHRIDDLLEDGERLSPDEAMRRWCGSSRVLADPSVLDLLLQTWHKPVTMGRNGITINVVEKSIKYGQFNPAVR